MRILQTFLLPDSLVRKYSLSFAAANFSRNLISGGGFDKVYSLMPLTVSGELKQGLNESYEIVYSKWRIKKWGISKLAIFREQWLIFKEINNGDSIWLYNLNILNVFLFVLLRLFKPAVKLNIILLDFTPARNMLEQNYWYLKLINRADGMISLAEPSLMSIKNTALLAGVVSHKSELYPRVEYCNKEFILSGVISSVISSTSMVLKAFSELPDCILHITGNVLEGKDLIEEYSAKYANIKYYGPVSSKEYLDILHKVTYQLSTRDEKYPENQFNFPSKIVESLLHNRIVISTISYKQLEGIKYFKVDSKCDNFKEQILEICNIPNADLIHYANQDLAVREMFGTDVWNKTMSYIESYIK